jgi:hypothetical protein
MIKETIEIISGLWFFTNDFNKLAAINHKLLTTIFLLLFFQESRKRRPNNV